jgi:hypothetical protein
MRKGDMAQALKHIDLSLGARYGRGIAAVIGPEIRTQLGRLKSALRILPWTVSKQIQHVN